MKNTNEIDWEDNRLLAKLFKNKRFYEQMKLIYKDKIDEKYNWIFSDVKPEKMISDLCDECAVGLDIEIIE